MKRSIIFIVLSLLVVQYAHAEASDSSQTHYSFLVPMSTRHFNRSQNVMKQFIPSEGGDRGLILSRINQEANSYFFTGQSIGVYRNSYGDLSFAFSINSGIIVDKLSISFNLGLATGYEKCYKLNPVSSKSYPEWLRNNGLMPNFLLVISYTQNRIYPTLTVSPAFVNFGMSFLIK